MEVPFQLGRRWKALTSLMVSPSNMGVKDRSVTDGQGGLLPSRTATAEALDISNTPPHPPNPHCPAAPALCGGLCQVHNDCLAAEVHVSAV